MCIQYVCYQSLIIIEHFHKMCTLFHSFICILLEEITIDSSLFGCFYVPEIEDRGVYSFCPVCHSVILSETLTLLITFEQ